MTESLQGKRFWWRTRRLGKLFALNCARNGADEVIHHAPSEDDAEALRAEIIGLERKAWIFKGNLSDSSQAVGLIPLVNEPTGLHELVNSAAIFETVLVDLSRLYFR